MRLYSNLILQLNNNKDTNTTLKMSWKLTEKSPSIGQPSTLKLPLRDHQKKMLYRMISIEKNAITYPDKNYGMLADIAGAGKTSAIISLILADKAVNKETQNLIIVPQNIITQWIDEIEKFAGDNLTVKTFINYQDISSLYFESDFLKEYDILITTVSYYGLIMNTLTQNGNNVNRIIYDEIDTMDTIIKRYEDKKDFNKKLEMQRERNKQQGLTDFKDESGNLVRDKVSKVMFTWFISASLFNMIDDTTGFTFMGKNIQRNELSNYIVKCDDAFIKKSSFPIPEYVSKIYKCNSVIDKFSSLLSVEQLDSANSMSFSNIYSEFSKTKATCGLDIIKLIVSDYNQKIKNSDVTLKELKILKPKQKAAVDRIYNDIRRLEKDIYIYEKLIDKYHSISCNNSKCKSNTTLTVDCILNNLNGIQQQNTKKNVIKAIFETEIKNTNTKVLIFSDYQETFKIITELLGNLDISYKEMYAGNIKETTEAIESYKNKDIQVLLIDSKSSGAGLNLENTDIIIFVHRTDASLEQQVIGRAQRNGRKTELRVINLFNENEIV